MRQGKCIRKVPSIEFPCDALLERRWETEVKHVDVSERILQTVAHRA
jgi:hypothetical protein